MGFRLWSCKLRKMQNSFSQVRHACRLSGWERDDAACHEREPETGMPRRDVHLYREVTERIRAANVDVVLTLTAGMGGDMVFGPVESPLPLKEQGTDMGGASTRVEHVRQCLPEICTLDCGTMNF